MKKILFSKIIYILLVCAFFAFNTSCEDAKNSALEDNHVYLKDADFNKYQELYIDQVNSLVALPINLTHPAVKDIVVKVDCSEAALSEFNAKYKKDYVLYPAEQWAFDDSSVKISKGSSIGPLGLTVKPFTNELKESGSIYAIPVTISSAEGVNVLKGAERLIYLLKQVPYANVPSIDQKSFIKLKWNQSRFTVTDFTVEFLIYLEKWYNGNNKALFYAQAGANTQIYTRFENGGKGLDNADFEVNLGQDGYLNARPSSGKFELGKWYHIAFTTGGGKLITYIDGIAVAQKDINGTTIDLDFSGAKSYYFGFGSNTQYIRVSELRLWTTTRSGEQIKENMYTVNPKTEGLAAYWKLNEGTGTEFKDYTEKNDNAYTNGTPNWLLNQKLDIK